MAISQNNVSFPCFRRTQIGGVENNHGQPGRYRDTRVHGGRAPWTENDVLAGRARPDTGDPEQQTRRERYPVQGGLHQVRHGAYY